MERNSKAELRKELILKRDGITRQHAAEKEFTEKFTKTDFYKNAKNIMIYSTIRSEIGTNMLMEQMFRDKKTVILPKVEKESFSISPIKINSRQELKSGNYGILEPVSKELFPKRDIDLVLTPGLAFDKSNNRLGYGAGYYDRFFADFDGLKIGVCYEEMLLSKIPSDEYDIKMDFVIVV